MPSLSQTVRVRVLFFGRVREITGRAEESSELVSGEDIEALFAKYAARHPQLGQFRPSLVASCNREFSAWDTILRDGDEVAFLPPVSGG